MKGEDEFMIGDTVKVWKNFPIPSCEISHSFPNSSYAIETTIPAGSNAIVGLVVKGAIAGVPTDMYRLYFGLKDRKSDLWCIDEWFPSSCRMVLIEKTIPIGFGDETKITEYRDSDK